MQKEIILKGFTENPSDYECPDGELASAMGLVPEDSTMKPILPPKEMFTLIPSIMLVLDGTNTDFWRDPRNDRNGQAHPFCWSNSNGSCYTDTESPTPNRDYAYIYVGQQSEEGKLIIQFLPSDSYQIMLIHKGAGYVNYIVRNGARLMRYYYNENHQIQRTDLASTMSYLDNIIEANSIGNTLIVLTKGGMYYYLWKNGETAYSYLGDHLPELPISFGLQGYKYNNLFDMEYENAVPYGNSIAEGLYNDEMRRFVTNSAMAKINSFIGDHYTEGQHFIYPFFVRYAYRLYDGSLTMHSAPIFMPCLTDCNPFVFLIRWEAERDGDEQPITWLRQTNKCRLLGAYFDLDWTVVDESNSHYKGTLANWSDIISSVDVFISEPIYNIDQSGECYGWRNISGSLPGTTICKDADSHYSYRTAWQFLAPNEQLPEKYLLLPLKNKDSIEEKISSTSRFYLLRSFNIDELPTTRTKIDIPSGCIKSLTSRELMTDDYDSHHKLIPKYAFTYNSRLNLSDLSQQLTRAFNMASMIPYTNYSINRETSPERQQTLSMKVLIKTDEGEVVVKSEDLLHTTIFTASNAFFGMDTPTYFLYYPDRRAYKAILEWRPLGEGTVYREIPLTPHSTLNGAFYFTNSLIAGTERGNTLNETSRTISISNKLYTSEVNNPFFFPVSGIKTIGVGTILGIMSAANPISPNEYGKFPLYAFTDGGIWALEVTDTGTFKPAQPATFDVCIDAGSITQINTSVLFATSRGIMMMSGKDSICISDELTTNNAFDSSKLPNLDKVLQDYAEEEDITYVPFLEYVKGCRMIYDYVHQRIIVFNPETEIVNGQEVRKYSYAYVYSLKSKKWGMMYSTIAGTVNSYPNALAVTKEGEKQTVVDYSEDGLTGSETEGLKGVIITRPIKLDEPDTLKTVNTVITRGKFKTRDKDRGNQCHVKTILYGSRDLENWHLIASSVDHTLRYLHGTPYKYFRLVLLCDLDKGESIISSTIEYTNKYADQIR